jgi:flagellar assembly protein FliH
MAKIVKASKVDQDKLGAPKPMRRSAQLAQSGVVHKRVMDASSKAEKIIEEAEAEAVGILRRAEKTLQDAEAEKKEAIRSGYASGESKGLAQVTEQLMKLQKLREEFYDNAEPEVIKLVTTIAEKVIGRAVSENPDMIKSVVRQALEKSLGDRITVRLNPEDYVVVMAADGEFKDVIDRTKRLAFREDDTIEKGGCVVETEVGTIDAQIEVQLKAIRKALIP